MKQARSMSMLLSPKTAFSSAPAEKPHLEVISVIGLDEAATSSLTQHLHNVKIPAGFSGEIVFEFPVENVWVGRIVLDDQASTLDAPGVVDLLKRSLLIWLAPQEAIGTVRLTLGINP